MVAIHPIVLHARYDHYHLLSLTTSYQHRIVQYSVHSRYDGPCFLNPAGMK